MITSTENPVYRNVTKLKLKKNRDKMGQYIIEGPNLIREAFENGGEIQLILYREDMEAQMKQFQSKNTVIPVSKGLFDTLSETETTQGVLAIVNKREFTEENFFRPGNNGASNIIVFDRLQDPGNIGTMIRTADAAGYMGAIILKGTGDIYSSKVVRAAAGSLFRLPVLFADTPCHALSILRKHKKRIICTSLEESLVYYNCNMADHIALIIGNEGSGVCEEFIINSDIKVKIPMEGKVESLNAAVAAGILMFESVRQKNNN